MLSLLLQPTKMKILKYLFFFLLFLIVVGFIAVKVISEKEPKGQSGTQADQLANQVLQTLNKDAYDTIPYLQWEFFRAGQKYFWNKMDNQAIIEWADNKVIMDLDAVAGVSYAKGVKQEGDAHKALIDKAWSNWCNDSFWMIAPFKLFDPGTSREIVKLEDGRTGLKISYKSGGVTPGDVFLWELDKNSRPTGWKMWTSILPVKGIASAWSGWENHMGAMLSTKHTLLGKEVTMKNVKAGQSTSDFGYNDNPFKEL